jgi:hypothetical protein
LAVATVLSRLQDGSAAGELHPAGTAGTTTFGLKTPNVAAMSSSATVLISSAGGNPAEEARRVIRRSAVLPLRSSYSQLVERTGREPAAQDETSATGANGTAYRRSWPEGVSGAGLAAN